MSNTLSSRIARVSTGMTAFVASGLLVYSILSGHGGHDGSQGEWQEAREKAVQVDRNAGQKPVYLDELIKSEAPQYIDDTITGSISSSADAQENKASEEEADLNEEVSVLSLIRKNSDIKPGVSSGTARVSIIVKSGDTLFSISKRHGISVNDLAELNGLDSAYTIKIGQTLYVAR